MSLKPMERWKDAVLVGLLSLVCGVLFFIPSGFEDLLPQQSHFARGRVISVDNSDVYQALIVKTGIQAMEVELLNGPYQGEQVHVDNQLTGKMEMDEVYVQDREILLEYTVHEGKPVHAVARGNYRLRLELILILLFCLLLILVGGWTGFKAMVSFVFSALMIWKIMVPLFLKGKDPILVGLLVVAAMTVVVSFLVGGFSRKGLVTFIGAFLGLVVTGILADVFTKQFRLHGAVSPFAETLLYSGFDYLNLTRIFVASVFICCSGAVMDLAMDISASMHEIMEKKPDIGLIEHIRSGMVVGRSVVGTMTTTLLLAYSGSYITLLMLLMGLGVPILSTLNRNFVAAEILNTIVGSFGMVTVAPFTALTGGLLFRVRRNASRP